MKIISSDEIQSLNDKKEIEEKKHTKEIFKAVNPPKQRPRRTPAPRRERTVQASRLKDFLQFQSSQSSNAVPPVPKQQYGEWKRLQLKPLCPSSQNTATPYGTSWHLQTTLWVSSVTKLWTLTWLKMNGSSLPWPLAGNSSKQTLAYKTLGWEMEKFKILATNSNFGNGF